MIQLTFHFDTVEAAAEFLATQGGRPPQAEVAVSNPVSAAAVVNAADVKKARKPRADKGQERGPYKKSDNAGDAPAGTQTGGSETAVSAPALAASPAPATPAPVAALTVDAIKAEMSILSKRKGIDANIQLLAKFGVQKISSLPEARYAEFVAAVRAAAAA